MSIRSHGNTLLKDGLLNSRLICSLGNRGPPETTTEAGPGTPAKKSPLWMPQWHVKECYVPPVPTLPVAGALCQASFPPSLPCPAWAVGTVTGARRPSCVCTRQHALLPRSLGQCGYTVPYSSQEDAKDRGWCQAADMSSITHTPPDGLWGGPVVAWRCQNNRELSWQRGLFLCFSCPPVIPLLCASTLCW